MMTMTLWGLFGALCVAHVVCDYPLQGDFLSKAKSRATPIPGVPWYQALGAHALMHGAAVSWLTGVWWLGALELAAHAAIDDAKCRGKLTFNQDQILHVACKAAWVWIVFGVLHRG
jgi:hypothetical protein